METYWHNLSQLYMKWKDGRRMYAHKLTRIYDVSSHFCESAPTVLTVLRFVFDIRNKMKGNLYK